MKDNVNLKLLKVLLEDSSAPLHEIGRKIGVFSPSAVSRRIKEMKRKRMITSETVVFDPKKIGLDYMAATFLKARKEKGSRERLMGEINKVPGIVSVYSLLGDIDYIAVCLCRDEADYLKIVDRIAEIDGIESIDSRKILNVGIENRYDSSLDRILENER
ncbi:MAG: Lrp/AsnC family transcriptional regulator [Thermoplasmataceae archaeon]|jgi:Lrp/AsnC family transcriptional regulator for asnA, asnC and gidA